MIFTNIRCFILVLFICFSTFSYTFAQDKDWRTISSQEIQNKTSIVEPNADVEAILWEVRVDDSDVSELALKHYVRVKIFTEKGREEFSKKDIVFLKGTKVKDVEARVTKPDGSTSFLKKEDVFEREIAKANGFKVKAKSFALPSLEIGSIVEYRYKEVIDNGIANMRLVFQREFPIQTISYYVKPFAGNKSMYWQGFNVGDMKFEKDKNGFQRATMNNVQAFREEPSMVPEDEVRSWVYIYYSDAPVTKPAEYWKNVSKNVYELSKNSLKPNDEVKKATAEVISGATTDDEKLRKIYDYCKTKIKNLTYSLNVSEDEWKKVREIKSGEDVLKLKMGSAGNIDTLFGAMARAAGYDARLAFSGSRNEMFFNPNIANVDLMVNSSSIAVKVGDAWKFFSPSSFYSQYGMMSWAEEDERVLISDSKELIFTKIPLSIAEKSVEKRSGKFKLLEDGTLEGEAQIEFTGHRGALLKTLNYRGSASEREKSLKDLVKVNILGTAEVENFTIENVSDPEKPFVYKFKVRIPNYASRTGKRLFFQPNVFERNAKPRFTSTTRKYDIYITYPWSEQDNFVIEFPAGYALESADSPALIKDSQGIGLHETKMQVTNDGKQLIYKRNFSFGNGGYIRFPATAYEPVKNMFESFNKADTHQLTLRQESSPTTTTKGN